MHYRIALQGTKKEVAAKLEADKGPDADNAAAGPLFNAGRSIALSVLGSQSNDDRQVEVIGYFAAGQPAGSVSFSLKVEG